MIEDVVNLYGEATQLFRRIDEGLRLRSPKTRMTEACGLLGLRISLSLKTLRLLFFLADTEHDWSIDGETLLRAMYDAELQAAYIMQPGDEKERERRAADYLDFAAVEKRRYNEKIYAQSNPTAQRFKEVGKFLGGPRVVKQEAENVMARFQSHDGNPRQSWHPFQSTDALARHLGRYEEYQYIVGLLHESVHTSALGMSMSHPRDARRCLLLAITQMARTYAGLVRVLDIQLVPTDAAML